MNGIDPGAGAVMYMAERVNGLTREEAAQIISDGLRKPPDDTRVKLCDYCGYLWRDGSLRNNKRTCCGDCKTALKTFQKAVQRANKALLTGKVRKKTKREKFYYWWYEYPFWLNEYEMLKQSWKHEVPHEKDTLDLISSNHKIYGEGNRKVLTSDKNV